MRTSRSTTNRLAPHAGRFPAATARLAAPDTCGFSSSNSTRFATPDTRRLPSANAARLAAPDARGFASADAIRSAAPSCSAPDWLADPSQLIGDMDLLGQLRTTNPSPGRGADGLADPPAMSPAVHALGAGGLRD
ncbi:MAG: hypothetical protein WED34_14150 [Planctomycetales bacterium]